MRQLVLLVFILSGAGGCGANSDGDAQPVAETQARRIVTLAPHLTELAFAAGAADRLVGVVEFSDYPPAARALPRVGDAFRLDHERIAALDPDLILGWASGNPRPMLRRLTELGYRVVALESANLDGVGGQLREIGRLAGTSAVAERVANAYLEQLAGLRERYAGAADISVLYQISAQPVLTISRRHLIGEAIETCGGRNIFAELDELTPSVSIETVVDRAPEVIIASGPGADEGQLPDGLSAWTRWKSIPAVRAGNLFAVEWDLIARPGPRILGGVRQICEHLAAAREKRAARGGS